MDCVGVYIAAYGKCTLIRVGDQPPLLLSSLGDVGGPHCLRSVACKTTIYAYFSGCQPTSEMRTVW